MKTEKLGNLEWKEEHSSVCVRVCVCGWRKQATAGVGFGAEEGRRMYDGKK